MIDKRPKFSTIAMKTAYLMSQRSTCTQRVSVGAVLVIHNRIIATGYNGSPTGQPHCSDVGCLMDESDSHCLRSVHAEINAILQCAVSGVSTRHSIFYVTHSPCIRCSVIIAQAQIQAVYYSSPYGSERSLQIVNEIMRANNIFYLQMKLEENDELLF